MRRAALVLALVAGAWSVGVAPAQGVPPPAVRPLASAWDTAEGRVRVVDAVAALFAAEYHDPGYRDWTAWAAGYRDGAGAAADRAAFDALMGRMLRELGDGHSSWVGRPDAPAAGAPRSGPASPDVPRLGVQLAYVEGRGLVVERVYAGTPAERAGLRRADVLTGVGDLDLRGVGSLFAANRALADALAEGPVDLSYERARVRASLVVEGAAVDLEAAAARPYGTLLDDGVGYLHVPTFNANGVAVAIHEAVRRLADAGARSLVVDLRGNLGGRVLEAGLAWAAFGEGDWVTAIARGEEAWRATTVVEIGVRGAVAVARLTAPDGTSLGEARLEAPVRFGGPVVVVVGAENASAAEVFAAALVEGAGARVVGETTAGNVEAVRAFALPDGSQVLVAIADLRTAAGTSLAGGVVPEVVARADVRDLARGTDPPVAEARRLLGALPFTPGRFF